MNPKDYKLALDTNEKICQQINALKEKTKKERSRLKYDVYDPKITALERERDAALEAVDQSEEKEKARLEAQRASLDQYKRFLCFIDAYYRYKDPTPLECYHFKYPHPYRIYYDSIDTLVQTKYLLIQVYITENKKPKNCFSLILLGHSPFNRDHIEDLHDYGITAHSSSCAIKKNLRDAPTKRELQEWYTKNKPSILHNWIEQHKALEAEYDEAVALFQKNKEWQTIYWERQRDQCSTNSEPFQFAEDMLTLINTPQKDLPLLLGHLKTDRGTQMLGKFLRGHVGNTLP